MASQLELFTGSHSYTYPYESVLRHEKMTKLSEKLIQLRDKLTLLSSRLNLFWIKGRQQHLL